MTASNSSSALPLLTNQSARRLFLFKHGLGAPMTGPGKGDDLVNVIENLGFIQVDSINTVARAHHMILAARRSAYREKHLKPLLEKNRQLFEHWTHDASIIPIRFYPHWKLKFDRDRTRLQDRWRLWRRDGFEEKFDAVLDRIQREGPVTSGDVGEDERRKSGGWWDWHPSKTALEFLWRTGALAVAGRNGFQKIYDLTERVIPQTHRLQSHDPEETVHWACSQALNRLGFATSGEIAAFFDLITPQEAKDWCAQQAARKQIIEIQVETADGKPPRKTFALPDILDMCGALCPAPQRIRILSPFDPMIRDRKRTERLFGFHYRIEVFVPEPKRQYGYYVFPVLEGEKLIGRIDMKAFRDESRLHVLGFWLEDGTKPSKKRMSKLESELARMSRFAGLEQISFADGWQKS